MEITITQYKHCDLVKVTGRVDSQTAPDLEKALKEINDDNRFKIVLDMSSIEYVSSAGLRVLINTQKNCKHFSRGELVLAAAPPKIAATFDLAGLDQLFKFHSDALAAVGSL